jgi:DNA-binding Xre family transcriptional regulator
MSVWYYAKIGVMSVRLRVRELAEERGLNLATFQREAKLGVSTARRLWHNTSDGNPKGPSLRRLDYDSLELLCRFFKVTPSELIEISDD